MRCKFSLWGDKGDSNVEKDDKLLSNLFNMINVSLIIFFKVLNNNKQYKIKACA